MDLGNIVTVDLTGGSVETRPYTAEMAEKFLGGFGFNTASLYRSIPAGTDALDPENIIALSCGLLTGTAAPSSSRIHLCAKSPLSGLMGSSNVGGDFGVKLSACGIMSIIIKGRAAEPVYLYVDEKGIRVRPAKHLWGEDTRGTEALIKEELGDPKSSVMCIGRAGENLIPYACIMAGIDHAAGRTGLGAVMGSKNLKAMAVANVKKRGKKDGRTAAAVKAWLNKLTASEERLHSFSTWGSAGDIVELYEEGALSTRNYRDHEFEGAENIDGRGLAEFVEKKTSCPRCPVHCKAEVKLKAKKYKGMVGGRPEYETIIDMGSLCGLYDGEALLYLSNLSNILGLDTISTGSVIAFAMDLYERGILTITDTEGIDLTWGNADAMEALMKKIAEREGIGNILSRGVARAAEIIGKGAEKYAYHAKGVEIYGGDPRGMMGIALSYTVSLRGGDFTSVYPIAEFRYSAEQAKKEFGTASAIDFEATGGKGALVAKCMCVSSIIDSLGLCKVPALSIIGDLDLVTESEMIGAITGIELTPEALFTVGERIVNMEKLFNLTHGATSADDSLPEKFTRDPIAAGAAKGRRVHGLDGMVKDFYKGMGWDEEGVPGKEKLNSLGIA